MRHRKLDAPYRLPPLPCGGPARLDPSLELNQGDPPCSSPPWPRRAACSDRFRRRELRVSQQISTFYEPSVQAMDTQLNAPSTLPVRARTVSGCVNSAFLGLERNRSAVGKTKAPLVAGGPQQLTPPTPQRRLSPGLESMACGSVGRERSQRLGGQEFVSRPGVNGEAVQVSREGALPVVGVVEGGPHGRGRARLAREVDLRGAVQSLELNSKAGRTCQGTG